MTVKSPAWKDKTPEEWKKILEMSKAEGMTEVTVKPQKGYEITDEDSD